VVVVSPDQDELDRLRLAALASLPHATIGGVGVGARSFFPASPVLAVGGVVDTIKAQSTAFSTKFFPFGELLAAGVGALGTWLALRQMGRLQSPPKTASDRSRGRRRRR
jgi:hypothetical protein